MAVPSFKVLYSQDEIPKADVTIKAIGYQWYWGYEYPDENIIFDSYMIDEKDLKEIPSNVVANLEIIPVKWIEEVFELALVTSPKSIMPSKKKDTSEKRGGSRRKEMPKTESASTH